MKRETYFGGSPDEYMKIDKWLRFNFGWVIWAIMMHI